MALETKAHSLAKEELGGKGGRERERETERDMGFYGFYGFMNTCWHSNLGCHILPLKDAAVTLNTVGFTQLLEANYGNLN